MNKTIILVLLGLLCCYPLGSVYSAEDTDDQKLDHDVQNVNDEAKDAQGEKAVTERFEQRYNVTDAQIQSLRDKKLGYGEIGMVYSLAKQMPGGITDANVQKIMDMRESGDHKEGWGKIAQNLGLKAGPARSHLDRMTDEPDHGRPEESAMHGQSESMHTMDHSMGSHGMGMGRH